MRPDADRTYQLRVTGHLDDRWSPAFGELVVVRAIGGTSTLTGPVIDQAQLYGILDRLRDLGATLVSLHEVAGDDGPVSDAPVAPARARDARQHDGC